MRFILMLCFLLSYSLPAAAINFLMIADVHYGSGNSSSDGSDTGDELLKLSFNKLQKLSTKVDFILNLGDLPTHNVIEAQAKGRYEEAVMDGLFNADQAKKPLFYIMGNNDSLGGNYQSFSYNGITPLHYAPGWTGACAYCNGLLVDDSHMKQDGYYATYVMPNNKDILMIVLNTTPWSNRPAILPKYPNQDTDATTELDWLEQQMKRHKAKQLLIALHIPPGTVMGKALWQEPYLNRFIHILNESHTAYGEITLLTAHTHMDDVRVIKLEDGTKIYAISAPSISRAHHNNPGLKEVFLNKNLQVANYTTYYTTYLNDWGSESYQAMGSKEAVFAQCLKGTTLVQCLNSLSTKDICKDLADGLFFSVKSSTQLNSKSTYDLCLVNHPVN